MCATWGSCRKHLFAKYFQRVSQLRDSPKWVAPSCEAIARGSTIIISGSARYCSQAVATAGIYVSNGSAILRFTRTSSAMVLGLAAYIRWGWCAIHRANCHSPSSVTAPRADHLEMPRLPPG